MAHPRRIGLFGLHVREIALGVDAVRGCAQLLHDGDAILDEVRLAGDEH